MSHAALKPAHSSPNQQTITDDEAFALCRVRAVAAAGERLLEDDKGAGEFRSLDESHNSYRNGLEGLRRKNAEGVP